jgi:exonuclease III
MGNYYSVSNSSTNDASTSTIRLMSYNVEWGFLKLPSNVKYDACGNTIPHTDEAQKNHLKLVGKNIGLLSPDICFLQEIGSKDALNYICEQVEQMFNIKYSNFYSNDEEVGYQGVGVLINNPDSFVIENIPNFPLNRAIGVSMKNNNNFPVIVGVHLKSLYDQKSEKDIEEQIKQLNSVKEWINGRESIICGDFNNTKDSQPIKLMNDSGYTDLLESDKYIPNITLDDSTEFYRNNSKKLIGSKIDYIFASNNILKNNISSHIVNLHREIKKENRNTLYRAENSDHLPIIAIINNNFIL